MPLVSGKSATRIIALLVFAASILNITSALWGAFSFFPYQGKAGLVLESMLRAKEAPIIFRNVNQIYRYQSLFAFKQKFSPRWKSKYMAYRTDSQLPKIAFALVQIHTKENIFTSFLKKR